ncbi:MAG: prepilin-type N-terminal cleavage/methylation domain-containing protein [Phycisphaerae bacterium]|nr:prepilin-type N-terminal cleavage/methylation domain-containing protein [Phycisphaerae bacterium]
MIIFGLNKYGHHRGKTCKGFTLVELLVVMSIISLLLSVLLPSLKKARQQSQTVVCTNNIKQLGLAFVLYGGDYNGYAMPATAPPSIYWWGKKLFDGIDHKAGFVWPYLKSELSASGVYQCPSQRYGSYQLQGKPSRQPDDPKWITSTYGYNGYYLCPPQSGWYNLSGPWQKIAGMSTPTQVLAFADTLIDYDLTGKKPVLKNNFSLDPPYIYNSNYGTWEKNKSPTTCFRHNERANTIFVDGHSELMTAKGAAYVSPQAKIGSIGTSNAPYYVPNYLQWPKKR